MDKLEFVDAHVHFYDMQHPELVYGHWQPGVPHPVLGEQIQRLAERNYLAEDYIAETRNANVTKAIHVQAAIGSPDPVTETEWLQEPPPTAPASPTPSSPTPTCVIPALRPCWNAIASRPICAAFGTSPTATTWWRPDFRRGFALLEKYNLMCPALPSPGRKWQSSGTSPTRFPT